MADVNSQFQELIRHVPIPYPWETNEFVRATAAFRNRPITLQQVDAADLAGDGCGSGLWVACDTHDLILFAAETEWHADHIIAHEIAHMLLQHDIDSGGDATQVLDCSPLRALMPSLSTDAIRSVLGRSNYSEAREHDAETFADLVMVEATLPRRKPSLLRSTFFRGRHR